jgi:type VI secretion system protein ImpA
LPIAGRQFKIAVNARHGNITHPAMASPAVLDLTRLLEPIPGDNSPAGHDPQSDLSLNSPYLAVKDAYDRAREAERQIDRGFDEPGDLSAARQRAQLGWSEVCGKGPDIIATIGKDLRVAAWLTEALLRRHGLGGLRDGLLLAAGLVERYWDTLFPHPEPELDEESGDPRFFPFQTLSENRAERGIAPALRKVPITDGVAGAAVTFWDFENRPPADADQDPAISIERRLEKSAPEFMRNLVEDAEAGIAAANDLETALRAKGGAEAPGFTKLRELLGQIADAARPYAALPVAETAPMSSAEPATGDTPKAEPADGAEAAATAPRLAAGALDRQTAFRQLEEIAAFFRHTEPHSPIAYAIDNIVRRGRMTLPELMRELISDDATRQSYFLNAGMRAPEETET